MTSDGGRRWQLDLLDVDTPVRWSSRHATNVSPGHPRAQTLAKAAQTLSYWRVTVYAWIPPLPSVLTDRKTSG